MRLPTDMILGQEDKFLGAQLSWDEERKER